ncbi:MAG: aminotransferase class V-fold PLP-dependent enzyme [Candidatus Woesearchaeota archaeon]
MLKKLFKKEINLAGFRKDFPILERKIKNKPMIYFDNACMSLRPTPVIEKSNEYYYNFPGCAGRSNHLIAQEVHQAVEEARKTIADFFQADSPKSVIFTKNCTEGINLVANAIRFQPGEVVLTSDKEHNSNLIPWLKLKNEGKIKHDFIESTSENEFSLDHLRNKLREHTGKVKLVSVVFTSNLDGVTNPVKEIIEIAHKAGALVLLDCAQAAQHQEINMKKLGADFISVSAHKLCGPNGVGALISTQKNLPLLQQFIVGGETVKDSFLDGRYTPESIPERFEAGLQNYPGIIGFAEALRYLKEVGLENIHQHLIKLNEQATIGLSAIETVHLLGPQLASKRSGIVSFVIEGKSVHEVSLLLNNLHNIMVRSGAHCVHGWFNQHPDSWFKDGTVRASFGFYNTSEEVELFVRAIEKISRL